MEREPMYLLAQWHQFPIDIWLVLNSAQRITLAVLGFFSCGWVAWRFLPLLKKTASVRFWALSMVFAIVPFCAALPMERLIFFTGMSAFALLGYLLTSLSKPWRSPWLWLHLHLAIGLSLLKTSLLPFLSSVFEQVSDNLPKESNPNTDLVLLNGLALPAVYAFIIPTLDAPQQRPRSVSLLAHASQGARVERIDDVTLRITAETNWLNTPFESILRNETLPPLKGLVYQNSRFAVTVIENTPKGKPKQVQFQFSSPLEDKRWVFLCARDHNYETCQPPEIGETMWLPGLLGGQEIQQP